ncbi:MAG: hypothetical protein JWM16_2507 [Verrucomicrobiales bacterium]|nr:hypothetical protein [Verrucomicrobiales bacterium]
MHNHNQPLVVCWGMGQDSTGMIIGLKERNITPDLIIVADVGSERPETYQFRPIFDDWLESVGFPKSVSVRYQPKNYKHWPPYYSLLENCLTNVTLPSLAYGYHTCSAKWKITPINKYVYGLRWAQECWARGEKILKAIGFDDSPHEKRRAERGRQTFAIQNDERDKYELWFPLQDWGWTREHCVEAIKRAGLLVPPKSSCYFCPAMKPFEVDTLGEKELKTIVVIEARTRQRHLSHAAAKGWPKGEGVPLCDGLWRQAVKGTRGGTPKPGNMTQYIRDNELLPAGEIDRIIAATPHELLTQSDFNRLGFSNWQDWLDHLCEPALDESQGQLQLAI